MPERGLDYKMHGHGPKKSALEQDGSKGCKIPNVIKEIVPAMSTRSGNQIEISLIDPNIYSYVFEE